MIRVILATIEDVTNLSNGAKDYADTQLSEHAYSRNHPDATTEDKGFTRLSNAINSDDEDRAATPKAVKPLLQTLSVRRGRWIIPSVQ